MYHLLCFDCLQDALGELLLRTRSIPEQPPVKISGLLPYTPSGAKGSNAVHPAPGQQHADWSFSRDHSSDDEDEVAPQQLVAAAMFLLQDSSLAGASAHDAKQLGTPAPARDWDQFVQQHLDRKGRAAASAKLLAMRNAAPSASARLVYASQVGCECDSHVHLTQDMSFFASHITPIEAP